MDSSLALDEPQRPNLFGLDRAQLRDYFTRYGEPSFRAGQVYQWLYGKREMSVAEWTDLPRSLRERLLTDVTVDPGRLNERAEASDGTIKYRVALSGGGHVESVFMVQGGRATLCLSSQVGCALGCDFCLTARMGLVRHLSPGEIVGQVALIERDRALGSDSFNVVFMGMGEPFHNYESVLAAVRLLTDSRGLALSRRRITVSTSGLAPGIERMAAEPVRPQLAVSLNATTDELRSRIMPVNRKHPLERLLRACRSYAGTTGDRITFEYVLLAGLNDSADDSRRLARMVHGVKAKVNLIPFNPVPGRLPYDAPGREQVLEFRRRLLDRQVPVSIRWSRGAEAQAACGQLALGDTGAGENGAE